MSNLQNRINEETKSVQWSDIFTPEEREKYIELNESGEKQKAKELFDMAVKRGESYPA